MCDVYTASCFMHLLLWIKQDNSSAAVGTGGTEQKKKYWPGEESDDQSSSGKMKSNKQDLAGKAKVTVLSLLDIAIVYLFNKTPCLHIMILHTLFYFYYVAVILLYYNRSTDVHLTLLRNITLLTYLKTVSYTVEQNDRAQNGVAAVLETFVHRQLVRKLTIKTLYYRRWVNFQVWQYV